VLTSRVSYPAFTDPRVVDCTDGLSAKVRGIGMHLVCEGSSDRSPRYCWLNTQRNVQRSTLNVQSPVIQARGGLYQAARRDPWGPSKIAELLDGPRSARRSDGFG